MASFLNNLGTLIPTSLHNATTSSSDPSITKANFHSEQKMDFEHEQKLAIADAEMGEKVVSPTEPESSSLPPADGGIQAWLFLAGCYMMELLVFGTYDSNVYPLYILRCCCENFQASVSHSEYSKNTTARTLLSQEPAT
jgi:hypothetical protein